MIVPRFNFKKFIIPVVIAVPFILSCKDKPEATEKINNAPQEITLQQKKQAFENAAPATTTNRNTNGNATLNPEHGQPGHRCDIPVGSPLNTAAAGSSTPAPTTGGGGINPPHGQPGHNCGIKVGDPL